jgi:hypothetical protein
MRPLLPTLSALLIGLASTACDRYDLEGEFVGERCEEQRVHFFAPPAGSVEGYVFGPVWLDLRCTAAGSSLSVIRSDNQSVEGTVSLRHADHQVLWRPSERLNPQTQYIVHYEALDGLLDWAFTTNGVGSATNNELDGAAFAVHPTEGELLDPRGVADVLLPALARGFFPVIEFTGNPSGSQGSVPVRVGGREDAAADSPQDLGVPTHSTTAEWDNPLFEIGPMSLIWPLRDFDFILENARFGGGISRDVAWGAGFSVEGWWDTRPAEGAFGEGGSPCDRAAAAGSECAECSDGARSCLRFELVLARAEGRTGGLVDVP